MDLTSFGVEKKENNPSEVDDKNLNLNIENIKKNFNFELEERFLPWFLKYKIEKFDDLIVTDEIKKIIKFIEDFKPGKGLLLYGQAGSGKTTTLTLLAEKYDFEIFELNASDARNKKSILESVSDVIRQRSLFNKEKIILIDEVDGVSGTYDRGGVAEIVKIVKTSKFPIVFTANDKDANSIKNIKKVALAIDFENHSKELLKGIAKRIFEKEKVKFDEKELEDFIEKRNSVDIRGFINDLQANTIDSKFEVSDEIEIRNYKKKIEGLLDKIYFSYPHDSYTSSFNSDINMDDLFLYLEENTPNMYSKKALIQSFNEIAKADVFKGRILRWQHWRFLVYMNFYLTFGVSCAKEDESVKKDSYKQNGRILKKWIYGNKYNAIRARTKIEKSKDVEEKFIEKLAKIYGRSAKKCRSSDLYYFAKSYQNDEKFREKMKEKLEIDSSIEKILLEL